MEDEDIIAKHIAKEEDKSQLVTVRIDTQLYLVDDADPTKMEKKVNTSKTFRCTLARAEQSFAEFKELPEKQKYHTCWTQSDKN